MDKNYNVLIVEDSPMDLFLLREGFTRAGINWNFTTLNNGEKALTFLNDSANCLQDIVLLDLKIPRLNGFEVAASIRCNERLKNTAIIVITSSQSPADMAESIKYNTDGYFFKPSDINGYNELISKIIEISKSFK